MQHVKSNMTYQEYLASARKAVSKKNKAYDARGLNAKKNYSSFWMDDEWDNKSKFSGLGSGNASSDMVKLVKLSNYRRAVTNFVKIVTKQDIPVNWAGSDSYTNGTSITLSTDIKDTNFDVTVGLALHESSHIILTDFSILTSLHNKELFNVEALAAKHNGSFFTHEVRDHVKSILNWVEDRRIDNYIFSTSPGYKAYYHKLYDHYWNHKEILKGFIAKQFRDAASIDSYYFHIINMINPNFRANALPGLSEIVKLVDLPNIARLQSTEESLAIAVAIVDIMLSNVEAAQTQQQQQQQQAANTQAPEGAEGQPTDTNEDGEGEEGTEDQEVTEEISSSEKYAVEKALQKQKDFLEGKYGKKSATKKLQQQLENAAKQSIELQQVGGDDVNGFTCLMYDATDGSRIAEYDALCEEYNQVYADYRNNGWDGKFRKRLDEIQNRQEQLGLEHFRNGETRSDYAEAIQKGIEVGGLLGKKLQLHNEARERVDNRLRNGKIDNRRLAHAGYGIDSIFSQIHVDKYKKANLHISLDGSGSMGGEKWASTVQMTMAIAKAAAYTQGINVQVSIRVTNSSGRGDIPANIMAYDSRKNKLNHLVSVFKRFSPNSMTPEGLCFEAMIKKNQLTSGTSEMDSYFLNISDGAPGMNGYGGMTAVNHTARQITKMRNELDMKIISFYIESGYGSNDKDAYTRLLDRFTSSSTGAAFRTMYGKDASVADCNSAIGIAKELNKKFLSK